MSRTLELRHAVREAARGRRQLGVDALTGLGDRAQLLDRGRESLAWARRSGRTAAVLVVGLDDFDRVTSDLGPRGEDAVLVESAVRISGLLGRDDVVSRIGDDEFAVLTAPLDSPTAASELAHRIVATVGKPVDVAGRAARVTASVGVALLDRDGATPAELLASADRALGGAKAVGGAAIARSGSRRAPAVPTRRCVVGGARRGIARNLWLAADLRRAVADGALEVHYQPQVDARSGQVAGFEALVRWEHPRLGLLMPRHFLPLAERVGLLGGVDEVVAARALADLPRLRAAAPRATLSLNVSAHHRAGRGVAEAVGRQVRAAGTDPAGVLLELTESSVHPTPDVVALLGRVEAAGLGVSVRGFAHASSGLRWLLDQPCVREVKIDPELGAHALTDPVVACQLATLVTAAHRRGVRVVAEGLESEAAVTGLRRLGADALQGLWLGGAACVEETLAASRARPAVRGGARP